jgi:hypothetical protein
VIPEWYRQLIPELARGVPNLILNQNAYEMFSDVPFDRDADQALLSSDTMGIVSISEDNVRYLGLCFPRVRIETIRLSIDTGLFHPSLEGKTRTVAFMPRKRLKELNQILHILRLRGSLDGWDLQPIVGLSETEVARILGSSAIFLSLNEREGIALPSLEAMAAGCVVVGFHGGSGLEYMKSDVAVPIADGDVASFVESIESEMTRWIENDVSQKVMMEKATDFVTARYTPQQERTDVVRVFGETLERVKDIEPSSDHLNWRLIPANGAEMTAAVRKLSRKKGKGAT